MNGTLLGQTKGSDAIVFLYDEKANKYGFDYNGAKYYYIFNVQGDVISILNQAGNQIVSYTYDAWGKVLSVDGSEASTIGQLNPIRYRGYYYDTETGFYYLQSRYYDPITRRFLNADGIVGANQDILSYNLFAYCGNNPINYCDPSGCYMTPYDRLRVLLASGKAWYDAQGKLHVPYSAYKTQASNSGFSVGAGMSIINRTQRETSSTPKPFPVSISTGLTTDSTVSKIGDSSKTLSVYAIERSDNIWLSSVGLNINIYDFTVNLSLGLDNIGLKYSYKNGQQITSYATVANLSQFKIGGEWSTTVIWDKVSTTNYVNVSVDLWTILAIYGYVTTGSYQPNPSPQYN